MNDPLDMERRRQRNEARCLVICAVVLVILILTAGCGSMLPQKRTDSAAVKTAENVATQSAEKFKRVVEGERAPPPPQVTVTGSSNTVQIAAAAAPRSQPSTLNSQPFRSETTFESAGGVTAGSTEAASAFSQVSLPLGVTLILCALGIIAMLGAFWLVRRSSAAANEAYRLADETIAGRIRTLRARATESTQPEELNRLNAERADLEEERGRLSAKLKKR